MTYRMTPGRFELLSAVADGRVWEARQGRLYPQIYRSSGLTDVVQVTRQVRDMERAGLVCASTGRGDVPYVLTGEGRTVLTELETNAGVER